MNHRSLRSLSVHARPHGDSPMWMQRFALIGLVASLNALFVGEIMLPFGGDSFWHNLHYSFAELQSRDTQLWLAVNSALFSCYLLTRWRYASPMARMRQLMHQTSGFLEQPLVPQPGMASMLGQMAALSALVKEQSRARRELMHELDAVRQVLTQCMLQQDAMLTTTNREIITQYQSVLAYANYLDEQVTARSADSQMRFDFDDVCESSFILKLIGGALEELRRPAERQSVPVPLAGLMQQTMLALVPSLERRAMKLTTAEVDESVIAQSDPRILTHVVWMMLLGLIRYAADESTLRMRCLYDSERNHAMLSIVVNELAPGRMTPDERAAHLIRQMQHGNAPMFAETIRIHAQVQLAELLLKQMDARIEVVALSGYACEICLSLPAGN